MCLSVKVDVDMSSKVYINVYTNSNSFFHQVFYFVWAPKKHKTFFFGKKTVYLITSFVFKGIQ
jgi:hypothetical protein